MVSTANTVCVLLVDDHPVLRRGVRHLLERSGYSIEGEAGTIEEARQLLRRSLPDVLLLDVRLPDGNGLELLSHVDERVAVIIYTADEAPRSVAEALRSGALSFVSKGVSTSHVLDAIRAAARGERYLDPETEALLQTHQEAPEITPREREIILLIAEGLSSKEIAQRLEISVRTVETHRQHIMRKLNVRNVVGIVRYAVEQEIIQKGVPPSGVGNSTD